MLYRKIEQTIESSLDEDQLGFRKEGNPRNNWAEVCDVSCDEFSFWSYVLQNDKKYSE